MDNLLILDDYRARSEAGTIGGEIKKARNTQHVSQDGLGKRIGYSQPEISRMETGKVGVAAEAAVAIAKALGSVMVLDTFCDGCRVGAARKLMVEVTVREVGEMCPQPPQPPRAA